MVFLQLKFNDKITEVVVDQNQVTIGRSKSCTYTVADSNLSSMHCKLYIKDNYLFVEDLDSKNGILLNSIEITKEKIYLTDIVNMGSSTLTIDRLKLDPDSIEILTAPATDDRKLTLELESSYKQVRKSSSTNSKSAFNIKSKNVSKRNKFQNKVLSIVKICILIIVFLIIYKLLR